MNTHLQVRAEDCLMPEVQLRSPSRMSDQGPLTLQHLCIPAGAPRGRGPARGMPRGRAPGREPPLASVQVLPSAYKELQGTMQLPEDLKQAIAMEHDKEPGIYKVAAMC